MGSFLVRFNPHEDTVSRDATWRASHYGYNLLNNSIAHNMFFLPGNLEKEKNKSRKCEKLSTKSRSEIVDDHFPCNGSIFLDMDTIFVF